MTCETCPILSGDECILNPVHVKINDVKTHLCSHHPDFWPKHRLAAIGADKPGPIKYDHLLKKTEGDDA